MIAQKNTTAAERQSPEFAYLLSICEAIESLRDLKVKDDPQSFKWKNVDLRYAVDRFLYFELINHPELSRLVRAQQSDAPTSFRYSQELAWILQKKFTKARALKLTLKQHLQILLGRLWSARSKQPHCEVLFAIHNPKFIRLLKPVFGQLQIAFGLLIPYRAPWKQQALDSQIPLRYIDLAPLKFKDVGASLRSYPEVYLYAARIHATLKRLRPKTVVVVEGNGPSDEVTNQVAKQLGIQVICIQNGWSPYVHVGFKNLSFDCFVSWGEKFSQLLKAINPRQSFTALGNPLVQSSAPVSPETSSKNRILILMQAPTLMISPSTWERWFNFILVLLSKFPDQTWIIREHPAHPLSETEIKKLSAYRSVEIHKPQEVRLATSLADSKISLSLYSSTLLESAFSGTLPIACNFMGIADFYPDLQNEKLGYEVRSEADAAALIADLLRNPQRIRDWKTAMAAQTPSWISAFDSEAAARIARYLESTCH